MSRAITATVRREKRLLIITSGHLSRNPRIGKEATALANAGYDVTVLRVSNLPDFERYDQELLAGAPFACITLNQQRGASGSFVQRLSVAAARRMGRAGFQIAEAFGPVRGLYRMARTVQADLTIVHTEAPFAVGRHLLRAGRRIAADFEDWHSEDLLPSARAHRPFRLLRELERTMMLHSAYTSTTSAALASRLQQTYGGAAPTVVRNTFPIDGTTPHLLTEAPCLFWFSQTVGPGRGLDDFIDGWSKTKNPSRLVLLGTCETGYRAHLIARAGHRREHLSFAAPISPVALPTVIARHDIGLALEQSQPPSRDLTITNKLFQYANAGLAIVASATTGQTEALALAPGAGVVVDRTRLASQIDNLLASRDRIAAMRAAARKAATTVFSWEIDAARLLAAVDSVMTP